MTSAGATVRRGTPGDRAYVLDLGRRSSMSSVSALRTADVADVVLSFERLVEWVYERQHVALIAEVDGRRAGFLLMMYDIPDEVTLIAQAFIPYTAVEPTLRRSGVGRALLDEAERCARAAGLEYLSLMVTEDNAAARALYDGAGFVTERRMMTKPL